MELIFWIKFELCRWLMSSGIRFGRQKGVGFQEPLSILQGYGASMVATVVVMGSWALDNNCSGSHLISFLPSLLTIVCLLPTKSFCLTFLQWFSVSSTEQEKPSWKSSLHWGNIVEKWRLRIKSLFELWIKPHLNQTYPKLVNFKSPPSPFLSSMNQFMFNFFVYYIKSTLTDLIFWKTLLGKKSLHSLTCSTNIYLLSA